MRASQRLADRYKRAFEHPSEEARKDYLKKHPKADPSKHTVNEGGEGGAKPDEEGQEQAPAKDEGGGHGKPPVKPEEGGHEKAPAKDDEGHGEPAKEKPKGGFFKGLSDKAKAFVGKSSAAVQKFVSDAGHRAQVLEDAGKSILASPKTYAKRLVETTKHEVHEFKEAGAAIKTLAQGKKLDHHQKKALKTVAIHMSIAVAAAALTSTGVLAGAAALGKGMVQKIALKAAAHALENVHLVQEIHHIGHGAGHLMHLLAAEQDQGEEDEPRKIEKLDPAEAFAFLVMQSVVKSLKELNDEDMTEVLEGASGEQVKEARRKGAALQEDLPVTLAQIGYNFQALDAWLNRFNSVMVASRKDSEGLPDGRVWQDRFVRFFGDGDAPMESVRASDQILDDMSVDTPALAQLINQARQVIKIPQKAEIAHAISDIEFAPNPKTGRDGITYSIATLKSWAQAVEAWSDKSQYVLRAVESKASRLLSP